MDFQLTGVTIERFREALREGAEHVDVIEPAELREPVKLWLRSVEEMSRRQDWKEPLGHPVHGPWEAAQAVLDEAGRRGR